MLKPVESAAQGVTLPEHENSLLRFSVEFKCSNFSYQVSRIGVLGPTGTSSEHAASFIAKQLHEQGIDHELSLFDTFGLLKNALQSGDVDLAVVPHAYSNINEFYMESDFELGMIFMYPTPVYGLAKRKGVNINTNDCKISTHPAPLLLLKKLTPEHVRNVEVILADSTSVAARQVQEGEVDYAITNEQALINHDLEFVTVHGEIPMSWSLFCKKPERCVHV